MNRAKLAGGRRIRQNKRKSKSVVNSESQENNLRSVEILNNKILDMKDNDYIKFRDFSTKLVNSVTEQLKRVDFKDRSEFRVFKVDRLKFLYKTLFTPSDLTILTAFADVQQTSVSAFTSAEVFT